MTAHASRLPPASPCVGVCVIDEARGICTGCARSLDEIAVWGGAGEAARAAVWADLPARAAAMDSAWRRLDWRGAGLLAQVAQAVAGGARLTIWTGDGGALVCDRAEALLEGGAALSLHGDGVAAALAAPAWLTAFGSGTSGDAGRVLAVPRGRLHRAPGAGALAPCLSARGVARPAPPAPLLPGEYVAVAALG